MFQKLVILAVSLVFAAQGAMAAPLFCVSTVGIVSQQENAHKHGDTYPEPIVDSTLQNLGDIVGVVVHNVLPEETSHDVIHGAGGATQQQQNMLQPTLESALSNLGKVVSVAIDDIIAGLTTH